MQLDVNTVSTVIGAMFWFILGYLGRQTDEAFEPKKLFKTLIVAFLVGVLVVVFKVSETEALQTADILARIGAIAALEKAYSAYCNRIRDKPTGFPSPQN